MSQYLTLKEAAQLLKEAAERGDIPRAMTHYNLLAAVQRAVLPARLRANANSRYKEQILWHVREDDLWKFVESEPDWDLVRMAPQVTNRRDQSKKRIKKADEADPFRARVELAMEDRDLKRSLKEVWD